MDRMFVNEEPPELLYLSLEAAGSHEILDIRRKKASLYAKFLLAGIRQSEIDYFGPIDERLLTRRLDRWQIPELCMLAWYDGVARIDLGVRTYLGIGLPTNISESQSIWLNVYGRGEAFPKDMRSLARALDVHGRCLQSGPESPYLDVYGLLFSASLGLVFDYDDHVIYEYAALRWAHRALEFAGLTLWTKYGRREIGLTTSTAIYPFDSRLPFKEAKRCSGPSCDQFEEDASRLYKKCGGHCFGTNKPSYCSQACAKAHWKAGHKHLCRTFARHERIFPEPILGRLRIDFAEIPNLDAEERRLRSQLVQQQLEAERLSAERELILTSLTVDKTQSGQKKKKRKRNNKKPKVECKKHWLTADHNEDDAEAKPSESSPASEIAETVLSHIELAVISDAASPDPKSPQQDTLHHMNDKSYLSTRVIDTMSAYNKANTEGESPATCQIKAFLASYAEGSDPDDTLTVATADPEQNQDDDEDIVLYTAPSIRVIDQNNTLHEMRDNNDHSSGDMISNRGTTCITDSDDSKNSEDLGALCQEVLLARVVQSLIADQKPVYLDVEPSPHFTLSPQSSVLSTPGFTFSPCSEISSANDVEWATDLALATPGNALGLVLAVDRSDEDLFVQEDIVTKHELEDEALDLWLTSLNYDAITSETTTPTVYIRPYFSAEFHAAPCPHYSRMAKVRNVSGETARLTQSMPTSGSPRFYPYVNMSAIICM